MSKIGHQDALRLVEGVDYLIVPYVNSDMVEVSGGSPEHQVAWLCLRKRYVIRAGRILGCCNPWQGDASGGKGLLDKP